MTAAVKRKERRGRRGGSEGKEDEGRQAGLLIILRWRNQKPTLKTLLPPPLSPLPRFLLSSQLLLLLSPIDHNAPLGSLTHVSAIHNDYKKRQDPSSFLPFLPPFQTLIPSPLPSTVIPPWHYLVLDSECGPTAGRSRAAAVVAIRLPLPADEEEREENGDQEGREEGGGGRAEGDHGSL